MLKKFDIVDQKSGKNHGSLLIPSEPRDVTFMQYCTLVENANRIKEYLSKSSDEGNYSEAKRIIMIKEGLNEFFDYDFKDFAIGEETDGSSIRLTLLGLDRYIHNLVFAYKPKKRHKSWFVKSNGIRYHVPKFTIDKVLKKERNPKMLTGEVIESYVVEERLRQACEGVESDKLIVANGKKKRGWLYKAEVNFVQNLKKIAILCRQKDESMPTDDYEFMEWLDNRYVEFKDLDMVSALDIIFFLGHTTTTYKITHALDTTLRRSIPV